jgi:hypothetical protein
MCSGGRLPITQGEIRPREKREPTLMSMAVWGVVFPALVLLVLAYALWWAHSGER